MASTGAIVFNSGVLLAALAIMTFAGNYFVTALTSYANKLGLSKYFIGMVVVAVATSSPDIATSVMGLMSGRPEILSGVVLGGLALDLALLNGWFAILGRRVKLETTVIKGIEFVILGLMVLPYILMLDGELSRSEGAAMVLSFFTYAFLIWNRESHSRKLKKNVAIRLIWQDAFVFLGALLSMLIAARFAVLSAEQLSGILSIPLGLLAITVLALAAALPDAIAGTLSIVQKKGGEIGFGEAIGTTVMEVNLFTGIVALVSPIKFGISSTIAGVITLMVSSIFFMTILRKGVITWKHGLVFIGIYLAYIGFEVGRLYF